MPRRYSLVGMLRHPRERPGAARPPVRPIRVGEGLLIDRSSSGDVLRLDLPDRFDVRIVAVGVGGVYGWHRVLGRPGGTWIDAPGSGTTTRDPLYEYNGSDTLQVGDRVEAKREPGSGELRTQAERCP